MGSMARVLIGALGMFLLISGIGSLRDIGLGSKDGFRLRSRVDRIAYGAPGALKLVAGLSMIATGALGRPAVLLVAGAAAAASIPARFVFLLRPVPKSDFVARVDERADASEVQLLGTALADRGQRDRTLRARDVPDLETLVRSFEELVAAAKSVFPGRVLLNCKRADEILELMNERLVATEVQRVDVELYVAALTVVGDARILTSSGGLMAWPNLWHLAYVDISRKRLTVMIGRLRGDLTPFMRSPLRAQY